MQQLTLNCENISDWFLPGPSSSSSFSPSLSSASESSDPLSSSSSGFPVNFSPVSKSSKSPNSSSEISKHCPSQLIRQFLLFYLSFIHVLSSCYVHINLEQATPIKKYELTILLEQCLSIFCCFPLPRHKTVHDGFSDLKVQWKYFYIKKS